MTLTHRQISHIRTVVESGNVTMPSLKDDLVDHLCCEVEHRLKAGMPFDEALEIALFELAPDGLRKIQIETNALLQTKSEINMKRITFSIGLLATMMMSLGWLLNILRFGEKANMIFAIGALIFVSLFLPLLIYNYFKRKDQKHWVEKLRYVTGITSVILIGIAFLFKIMHMPGADEVLMAGGVMFTFAFLPILFFGFYKKSISNSEN